MHAHKQPRELYLSPTSDRGRDVADRRRLALSMGIQVYF
jgi:hypothetical protein